MLRYGLDNRYCKVDTYVHIFRSFINVIIKGAKWNLKEAVTIQDETNMRTAVVSEGKKQ